VSDINEPDDLLGMLPDEIIAAFERVRAEIQALKAEQAADVAFYRLTAQQRDQAWAENTALREAGEALWVELEDASHGYEGVHWKVQRDAPPVLAAWRALVEGREA